MNRKKLYIAGTGIKSIAHLTNEVVAAIKACEKTLYLLNEPILKDYVKKLANSSFDLDEIYFSHRKREDAYNAISRYIISELSSHNPIALIAYGHPFFCSSPFLYTAQKAENTECDIIVMPGISSLDCLLADLKIDPLHLGLQMYEATHLLNSNKLIDTSSNLIILQCGYINVREHVHTVVDNHSYSLLKEYLRNYYPNNHSIVIYEASLYPSVPPVTQTCLISEIDSYTPEALATIYIPALS